MKKYRKRIVPEYEDKYCDTDYEYYGIFVEREDHKIVGVKVDPKRLRKTHLIDQDLYEQIQSVNRNTPYFHPEKKIQGNYCFETFRYHMEGLKKLWYSEIKPAISKLKTPVEVGEDSYLSSISDSVLDPDECDSIRKMNIINRLPSFEYAISMFYIQFVLLLGAEVEASMIEVISCKGYTSEKFSREYLKGFVSGRVPGLDYTKFDNHIYYDKIYKLWNFIKHNNIDVYQKIKETYPELLVNTDIEYRNGDLAVKYLKLSEEIIIDLIDGVVKFFDEFCNKVFGERTDYEIWNTEEYYVNLAVTTVQDIVNPLGLPWYI